MQAAVIGAGSWGTTLAWLLAQHGAPVRLWARDPDLVEDLRAHHTNRRYLAEVMLPDNLTFTIDLADAVGGAQLVFVAVPSIGVADIAARLADCLAPETAVISAAKGLDHATGQRMTVVLADHLPQAVVGALSGPNLAHEIAAGQPSASVVSTPRLKTSRLVQQALSTPIFRVYSSPDIAGVELGGALKNPLAIAAGIIDGLGHGDNSKAALMTRGMHEMRRLGVALGAQERTFAGLCGFGDLLATCHSRQSRNRNLGEELGKGRKLADILAESTQVAEGVPTTRTALRMAVEHEVEVPILRILHAVLFDDLPLPDAAMALMTREITDEFVS